MINANELRIGNWVSATENFEKFPTPMCVIGVGKASYDCMSNYEFDDFGVTTNSDGDYNKSWPYKQIHPIPLTHDILIKCGFEKLEGEDVIWEKIKLSDFDLVYWVSGMYFITTDGYGGDFSFYHATDEDTYWQISYSLKYLHQLQNLYFALTNQELDIKL